MLIKQVLSLCIAFVSAKAATAGWCYYGGCHSDIPGILPKCRSMADSVGVDNIYILFRTQCDKWHERLWGNKHFCCTNDCQYQECGKSCETLGMKVVEENEHTMPKQCIIEYSGEQFHGKHFFCCKQ